MLGLDQLAGPAEEQRVVEDEQLRIEQRGQVVPGAPGEAVADLGELRVRPLPRLLQRRHFLADPLGRDREPYHLGALR